MKTQTGPKHPTANKQAEDLPAWMTIPQVSKHHGIDDSTTRRYIAKGQLKAQGIGPRLIRVERESVLSLGRRIGGAV
jgi:Helix-turn-helix domain